MNAISIQSLEEFADMLLAKHGGDVDRAMLSAVEDRLNTSRLWRRFLLERAGLPCRADEANDGLPASLHSYPDGLGLHPGAQQAEVRVPSPVRTPNPSRVNPGSLAATAWHSTLLHTFCFSTGEKLAGMTVGQLQRLSKQSARDAAISAAIVKRLPQCSGSTLITKALKPRVLERILGKFHG